MVSSDPESAFPHYYGGEEEIVVYEIREQFNNESEIGNIEPSDKSTTRRKCFMFYDVRMWSCLHIICTVML